jgi:hypothetical protein
MEQNNTGSSKSNDRQHDNLHEPTIIDLTISDSIDETSDDEVEVIQPPPSKERHVDTISSFYSA